MPALPWVARQEIDPDREYVAMASRISLRRFRWVPGLLRYTPPIRRQLARADGLVGYTLNGQPVSKTFWTFSVWTDQASLDALASADPHRRIIERIRPRLDQQSRFAFFTLRGSEVPLPWHETMARLRSMDK